MGDELDHDLHTQREHELTPAENDGRQDFDFFNGKWKTRHRRLKKRLSGSSDWEEFESTGWARTILGGIGNFDETRFDPAWRDMYGCTIRLFDPVAREWSLTWSDSETGRLFPSVYGRFENGVGNFHGVEKHDGRTVLIRFKWSEITDTTADWEQAFSEDGGVTWETNWYMRSTKVSN